MRSTELLGANGRVRRGADRLPMWLLVFVFAIPMLPSPALVPLFQPILVGFGLFGTLRALSYRSNFGSEYQRLLKSTVQFVLLLAVLSSISVLANDLSVSGGLRLTLIRSAFFMFVLVFSVYLAGLSDAGLRRTFRTYIAGIVLLCLVAVYISLSGNTFTGERLRPSRGIGLLPSGFKSAGVPRSYGEFAIILTGGLGALLWMWRDYRMIVRWSLLGLFLLGTSVSHSRNVYLSAGLLFAVFVCARAQARLSEPVRAWSFRALGYVAIFSPVAIAAFLGSSVRSSAIGAYFVGDGVLENNVEARTNHVTSGLNVLITEPGAALKGVSEESWFRAINDDAMPHNHFISLLVFGVPVIALVVIYLTYFRQIKWVAISSVPERTFAMAWLTAALFAFSNYQGQFAPSGALMLGVVFSIPLRKLNRDASKIPLPTGDTGLNGAHLGVSRS